MFDEVFTNNKLLEQKPSPAAIPPQQLYLFLLHLVFISGAT